MYSTSVVESATTTYVFLIQLIAPTNMLNTYPLVDLLRSRSLSQSTSTNPCISTTLSNPGLPWYHNLYLAVPHKYLKTLFTTLQCSFPGFDIYLLKNTTPCAIFGLLQTIAYIKLPTTLAYGTREMSSSSSSVLGL